VTDRVPGDKSWSQFIGDEDGVEICNFVVKFQVTATERLEGDAVGRSAVR
jgi:hypothetical protein